MAGSQPNGATIALRDARFGDTELAAAARRLFEAPAQRLEGAWITAVENSPGAGIQLSWTRSPAFP